MNTNKTYYMLLLIILTSVCVGVHLWDYLLFPTHFILGLCVLPILISGNTEKPVNYWFVAGVLFFLTMSLLVHVISFYYISFVFLLLFGISFLTNGINHLPLFLLGVTSPAFSYLKNMAGIPIRLLLSEFSASILSAIQPNISLNGNLVKVGSDSFMIDQACAGLNMLTYTLIIGLLLLAVIRNNKQIIWSFWQTFSLLGLLFGLSILSNLLRILILIQFKILPDNPIHHYTGIVCMVLVALLPFALFSWWVSTFIKQKNSTEKHLNSPKNQHTLPISLMFLYFIIGFWVEQPIVFQQKEQVFSHKNNYTIEHLNFGVTKYYNDSILVYEKPLRGFYSAEHSPTVCWKGSGYSFEKISEITINNKKAYYASLTKEGYNTLHSAWWFQSHSLSTTDQLKWRTHCLQTKEKFSLINVTAETKTELLHYLSR